jgi:hypothetical protein
MRWTNKPPTSDGWYWAQRDRNEAPEIIEVVLEAVLRDRTRVPDGYPVTRMGNEAVYPFDAFEFWSETPIPEPHWGPAMKEEG